MTSVKQGASVAALIGDVVGSRSAADRSGAARPAGRAGRPRPTSELRPVVPLRITVGDEFQGCFETVGEALHAALWLRLELLPGRGPAARHRLGSVAVLGDEPRVEDGPGWWAARDAIEVVKAGAARAPPAPPAYGVPPGRLDARA